MSGPLQWTGGGFVPATGVVPNAGEMKGGYVPPNFEPSPEPQARRQVQLPAAESPKGVSPKSVVAMAKARLREVKSELRRMKALEKERGELERLIAAAESKPPRSNLREIKRSTG